MKKKSNLLNGIKTFSRKKKIEKGEAEYISLEDLKASVINENKGGIFFQKRSSFLDIEEGRTFIIKRKGVGDYFFYSLISDLESMKL